MPLGVHRLPVQGTDWHTDNRGDLDAVESTATYYWYRYYWYRYRCYILPVYGKVSRIYS